MYKYVMVLALGLCCIPAFAQADFELSTSKQTYHYGDFFTFTIITDEFTDGCVPDNKDKSIEGCALLTIKDESGKSSAPIPILIGQKNTTIASPFPFNPMTYPEGIFTLSIEHAGVTKSVNFEIRDSGAVFIPVWIKDVVRLWTGGAASDDTFGSAMRNLIKSGIITIPDSDSQMKSENTVVPSWVKSNAEWWIEGLVSDEDFAAGIQYLIDVRVIVI